MESKLGREIPASSVEVVAADWVNKSLSQRAKYIAVFIADSSRDLHLQFTSILSDHLSTIAPRFRAIKGSAFRIRVHEDGHIIDSGWATYTALKCEIFAAKHLSQEKVMQPALLGVRQGTSKLSHRDWSQYLYRHGALRLCHESRRYVSSLTLTSPLTLRRRVRGALEEAASEDQDLSFSEALKQGIAQSLSRERTISRTETEQPPVDYPPPGSAIYGKWQTLSLDQERLYFEADINVSNPRLVRQVDQPGNETDFELWSCLLEFAHRRMGRDGVIMIWQSVYKRRNLYQVEGTLPQAFWRTILNTAVSSDGFLREVVTYAEWLYKTHDAQWPGLYSTVVSYMLRNGDRIDIVRWHVTLTPSFGPNEAEFVDLMKTFITDWRPRVQLALQTLYRYSAHRNLYDFFIPYLYNEGYAKLAMRWRKVFGFVNDNPRSLAARPFLRYVGAYYPRTKLTQDEAHVAALVINKNKEPSFEPPRPAIRGQNLSYLINRVHGETFGIQEKPYNDKLGAKWFASSWVPLDFAINVIHTMGIQAIGPLSLQSIALREGSAQRVLQRLDQLRQLNIRLPHSNYVKAIQHHAAAGNDKDLQELIHCDIHPDIFDDEVAQHELLSGCLRVGDWKTYRLVLKTNLAVLSGSVATSNDSVLELCVRQGNDEMVLKVLKEMSSHKLEPRPMTSHVLSSFILRNLSPFVTATSKFPLRTTPFSRRRVDVQISLCRQLAATRFPPAVEVWQTLLLRIGREQRLLELERLSLYILQLFSDYATSDEPMWIAHMADIPHHLRFESPYPNFQRIPRDLPLVHDKHPLRQIFDPYLQNSIVRWGFTYNRYDSGTEAAAAAVLASSVAKDESQVDNSAPSSKPTPNDLYTPADFHFARGIRLLAMLRDRGLYVQGNKVRSQVTRRLVELYRGEGRTDYEWVGGRRTLSTRRRLNRLSLAEAKRLCDAAWGIGEIVPSLFELNQIIELAERADALERMKKRIETVRMGR